MVAYLQNELGAEARSQFADHLTHCPVCSRILDDYRQMLGQLKTVPAETPRTDLSSRVLTALAEKGQPRTRYWPWIATAAGILVMITAAVVIMQSPIGKPQVAVVQACPPVRRALDWLAQNQEPTGKWDAEKWGGNKQYEIALNGLSIMALVGSQASCRAQYMTHIHKGTDYLMSRQSAKGVFGPEFNGMLYNHGIATVCLLEVYALTQEPRLQAPIKSALRYIQMNQTPDGGWGYLNITTDPPNTAISCWALQALLWAHATGFEGIEPSLKKGFQWLARISDESGRPGYRAPGDFPYGAETLAVMAAFCYTYGGADYLPDTGKYQRLMDMLYQGLLSSRELDYYRAYFLVYLEHPSLSRYCDDLSKTLSRNQSRDDAVSGSWEPQDQWGEVGGRIYSTALAALMLEVSSRAAWLKSYLKS